jgi:hypothetical protein
VAASLPCLQVKSGIIANWEAATDAKIARNHVVRELSALSLEQRNKVDARRAQLAHKLHTEQRAMQQELANQRVTPEQKRATLAARGKELWETREAERHAEANALLERHFRSVGPLMHAEQSDTGCATGLSEQGQRNRVRARQLQVTTWNNPMIAPSP